MKSMRCRIPPEIIQQAEHVDRIPEDNINKGGVGTPTAESATTIFVPYYLTRSTDAKDMFCLNAIHLK